MTSTLKHVLMLVGILAFGFSVYYLISKYDVVSKIDTKKADVEMQTQELERNVLAGLNELAEIQFDASLFNMREYAALTQVQQVLVPELPVYRVDPFAPYE